MDSLKAGDTYDVPGSTLGVTGKKRNKVQPLPSSSS